MGHHLRLGQLDAGPELGRSPNFTVKEPAQNHFHHGGLKCLSAAEMVDRGISLRWENELAS